MLTPIDDVLQVAGTTAQADKQIAATGSSNDTLLYTVPSGRKFIGWASSASGTSSSYYIKLEAGGTSVYHYSGFSTSPSTNMPPDSPVLTLLAGTSVKNGGGSTGYVFGVESDA